MPITGGSNKGVEERLDQLLDKEPHWTVVPTFCLVILSVVIGLIACTIAWLALNRSPTPESNKGNTTPSLTPTIVAPSQVLPVVPVTPSPKR
jgi:hypothetical protein